MESHDVKAGILIAVKGITETERKEAVLKIREYNRRGFRMILLTGEYIEGICGGESPTDRLPEKYYDIFKL